MKADYSKRGSTFYISKRDNVQLDIKQNQTARFLRDFWEVGPFRLNYSLLAKIPDPFDFQSQRNIFKDYLQPEKEFFYRKTDEQIFVIWKIKQSGDSHTSTSSTLFKILSNTKQNISIPDVNSAWQNYSGRLHGALPQWAELLKLLGKIIFRVALFSDIQTAKSILPPMPENYGICMRNPGEYMDLHADYRDGGNLSTSVKFAVFSPAIPLKQLPGMGSAAAAQTASRPQSEDELLVKYLLNADNERCRLSSLPANLLDDNSQGHWDLFWPEDKQPPQDKYAPVHLKSPRVGRDPAGDIQSAAVTIDFGTSSTVVATRDKYGQVALQRIGMEYDRGSAVTAAQFENPTVLHFDNLGSFLSAWRDLPYRPLISLADVQCSHEARHNNSDVDRLFAGLKTWARGKADDEPKVMVDKHGTEIHISVPARETLDGDIVPGSETALNPIELYAYFLGLHLNNQIVEGGRIFSEYYLTFPVKFERATREMILKSFRRGLLRSLPPSLIYASDWNADTSFIVEERANEPAAYAAAVLLLIDINKAHALRGHERPGGLDDIVEEHEPHWLQPTQEGAAFGVFDFGGGTTDFAIGLYRLPTAQEAEEEGWEKVVEILDTSGDPDLGGEHLLDELAFAVVCANRDKLLSPLVPFTKPPRAPHVTGGEELFGKSLIAQGNTAILRELLRPFWEEGRLDSQGMSGQLEATFKNRDGGDARLVLNIDEEGLRRLLKERIQNGVDDFFTTFSQAFSMAGKRPKAFHIILAGNSCKSEMVQQCFKDKAAEILDKLPEKEDGDIIYLHKPRLPEDSDPERVTLKTGVAIGLLQTLDGEPCGIVTRHLEDRNAETPFPYYIGPLVQDRLEPKLRRNSPYGQWKVFSKVFKHGKTRYLYTLSPQAMEENALRGKNCIEGMINWGADKAGMIIVARPISPTSVEFALKESDEDKGIMEGSVRTIQLEK